MNYLELIREIVLTESSIYLNSWSDISPYLYQKEVIELNNCLQDTWLNFNYLYREREIGMTTVVGQFNYDLPAAGFTGKIKQDGLLVQPVLNNTQGQLPSYRTLQYNENVEQFWSYGTPDEVLLSPTTNTSFGLPRYYAVFNNQVLLNPVPDKVYKMICLYFCRNWAISNASVSTPTGDQNTAGQNLLAVDHTQDIDIYGNTQEVFKIGDVVYIEKDTINVETGIVSDIDNTNNILTFQGNLTFDHAIGSSVQVERQALRFETDEPNCDSAFHNTFIAGALAAILFGDVRQQIYDSLYKKRISNMINESRSTQDGTQHVRITRHTW